MEASSKGLIALAIPFVLLAGPQSPAARASGEARLSGAQVDRMIGAGARDLGGNGSGPFRIEAAGRTFVTHGPDLQFAAEEHDAIAAASSAGPRRAPVCADQDSIQVLYTRVPGAPDRHSEVVGSIRDEIMREDALLSRESVASGGPSADYRVVCDGAGRIRVDSFVSPASAFQTVLSAARLAGFSSRSRNYTIFFDGPGPCGIGTFVPDERPTADNRSNGGGGYGVAYQGCWDEVPMHENAHNMGAVQYDAPNSTGDGAHCLDELDVMCYSDGGDRDTGTRMRCSNYVHFDCGHDDYFDSAPEPGEYLASHWNLGSSLNRFLIFGMAQPETRPRRGKGCRRLTRRHHRRSRCARRQRRPAGAARARG